MLDFGSFGNDLEFISGLYDFTEKFPKVLSQDVPINTTEDLLAAQAELSVGHEFTETLLQVNRNIISSYIEIVEQQLIDSFMDTYSEIQMLYE